MTLLLNYSKFRIISHLILFSALLINVRSHYKSHKGLINGFISPSVIDTVVGEEIYLKITKPVAQQTECLYRIIGGKDINVRRPHEQK